MGPGWRSRAAKNLRRAWAQQAASRHFAFGITAVGGIAVALDHAAKIRHHMVRTQRRATGLPRVNGIATELVQK